MMELSVCAASLLMIQNYEECLIPQLVVLPFRGASTGCRNGQRKTSLFQQRETQILVPREKQPSMPVHASDQTSGAQLYRERPGISSGHQAESKPAICPCCKEGLIVQGAALGCVASKWKKVSSAQERTHLEYDF